MSHYRLELEYDAAEHEHAERLFRVVAELVHAWPAIDNVTVSSQAVTLGREEENNGS